MSQRVVRIYFLALSAESTGAFSARCCRRPGKAPRLNEPGETSWVMASDHTSICGEPQAARLTPGQTGDERDRTAADRDWTSELQDKAAVARDRRAEARDGAAANSGLAAALDRAGSARDREEADRDRAHAAADRRAHG